MPEGRKTIASTFAELRKSNRLAFMPFISAGYPDLATTRALLPALEAGGASFIEIGFPFSDPIADGPTIQESYTRALSKKIKIADCFAAIAAARPSVSIPLIAMVSYSLVHRQGPDRFFQTARESGLDGLILPDLPPPEADVICQKINAAGLDTVLLIAPTTQPDRRLQIANLCTGFIYYLSISGITGARTDLPADLTSNLKNLRALTDKPVCVGFGISTAQHIAQLKGHADGAIVGSAIVKRITQHATESPGKIADSVKEYCKELLALAR